MSCYSGVCRLFGIKFAKAHARSEQDRFSQAREELALAYRLCDRFKYNEGVCNHLSYQIPGEDKFTLVKYGVHWSQATKSDILVLDFAGNVMVGEGKPEITGFFSHRALHKALGAEAACVLHTHQPWVTSLMALKPECGGEILPVQQGYLRFDGWVAYDNEWGGLFDEDASDQMTSAVMKFRNKTGRCPRILCSRNHGVFAFGASIADAWDNLYYIERLCEVQARALSAAGGDLSRLTLISDEALKKFPMSEEERLCAMEAHWEAMKGMMKGAQPDYRS